MINWIPKGAERYKADQEKLIELNRKIREVLTRKPKIIKDEQPDYTYVEQITLF